MNTQSFQVARALLRRASGVTGDEGERRRTEKKVVAAGSSAAALLITLSSEPRSEEERRRRATERRLGRTVSRAYGNSAALSAPVVLAGVQAVVARDACARNGSHVWGPRWLHRQLRRPHGCARLVWGRDAAAVQ
jgi:hypothetical protein